MKSLLKKNQIIITALAIMIAIAGYLNLTKDTLAGEKAKVDEKVAQGEGYEHFSESDLLAENEMSGSMLEISDEDIKIITCMPQQFWSGEHPDFAIPKVSSNPAQ